jgi:hypothetical protein
VVEQLDAPAQIGLELRSPADRLAGKSSRRTADRSGSAATISRRARCPPRSAATSSGSASEFVVIRGLTAGSAEARRTSPRLRGAISTGPSVSAWPSNSSAPWSTK